MAPVPAAKAPAGAAAASKPQPPILSISAAPAGAASTVPLHHLQLTSQQPLRTAVRVQCPACGKRRAFFCYNCLVPLMPGMPQLVLPIQVHIVVHGETNAQATGTHAAVLAPQCVTLWRHNDGTSHHRRQPAHKLQLPDWDPKTTAVLFPESPDTPVVGLWGRLEQAQYQQLLQQQAKRAQQQQQANQQVGAVEQQREGTCIAAVTQVRELLQELRLSCSADAPLLSSLLPPLRQQQQQQQLFPYKAVVILEGNWAKARVLLRHPKIASLPRIQLPPAVRSLFWRRGTGSFRAAVDCGVCTIEALYLLCRQLQPQPDGQWDDLLWLWLYQRELVQRMGSYQTRQEMQHNYEAACGGRNGS